MTLKQQVQQRLDHARVQARQQRDHEWEQWLDTPGSLCDILQCPDLGQRPSQRDGFAILRIVSWQHHQNRKHTA